MLPLPPVMTTGPWCVFLEGGMDHANSVIPTGSDQHGYYKKQRAALAVPLEKVRLLPGQNYGLSPELTGLQDLFTQTPSPLAILLNVGTLEGPTVRVQTEPNGTVRGFGDTPVYYNPVRNPKNAQGTTVIPVRLGSHNDQQLLWQTSKAEGAVRGWGGAMSDVLGVTKPNGSSSFSAIGIGDSPALLSGEKTIALQASAGKDLALGYRSDLMRYPVFGSNTASLVVPKLLSGLGISNPSYFEQDLINVHNRAIAADATLRKVPSLNAEALDALADGLGADPLYGKLKNVLRLIQAGDITRGNKRQVFFVQFGGFDTHSFQNDKLPALHQVLQKALVAFYKDLKAQNLQEKVTLFTASDFGRTLSSNNDGTDHGWGGHHFILGGAVNGGKIYGQDLTHAVYDPDLAATAPVNLPNTTRYAGLPTWETLARGVPVPTTSVHQYAATLASWMGVTDADMPKVIPQIVNYPDAADTSKEAALWPRKLGFMKA